MSEPSTNSAEQVKEAYERRKNNAAVQKNNSNQLYSAFISAEREKLYTQLLRSRFQDFSNLKCIEIGAGSGGNLPFFNQLGIKWQNIYANELIEERYTNITKQFPEVQLLPGDATQLKGLDNSFDIVFQSTVFTSILDWKTKKQLADSMWKMKKPDGILLWYDFVFDNPGNKDVKGVSFQEIKQLFPEAKQFQKHKVTLAPPIGRRVGKLYSLFNFFPFLRTHVVVMIS